MWGAVWGGLCDSLHLHFGAELQLWTGRHANVLAVLKGITA